MTGRKDAEDIYGHRAVEEFRGWLRDGAKKRRLRYWTTAREIQEEYTEDRHALLHAIVSAWLLDNHPRIQSNVEADRRLSELYFEEPLGESCEGLQGAMLHYHGELGNTKPAASDMAELDDVEVLLEVGEAVDEAVTILFDLPEAPPVTTLEGDSDE